MESGNSVATVKERDQWFQLEMEFLTQAKKIVK